VIAKRSLGDSVATETRYHAEKHSGSNNNQGKKHEHEMPEMRR
jgi:hypothetical protein